ncbi:hypothetical protein M9H77_07542 [Catharanthus roseus]|uniref:Uncharacterized protein n=1 Tax=Catharanthus roseus TaxID=4058 RepID=A0ACC0BVG3_CATRO|nr:hypothetical protein M9H77_07542 [Catharanthus roseus]
MVVAIESMLMVEATMDMETSFPKHIMVMETSLLKDIKELITSLLMLNLMGGTSYDDYGVSIVEEAPKVKELPHVKLQIEESLETHVEKEISNEDSCDNMNEKSIEIKEKERVEEKERLVERSYIFDSTSILSKESDHFECLKGKEHELEKSESIKENECYIENQESIKEEQKEKEVVELDKSEVRLECALLDILNDKRVGKFVENDGYFSSFLDTYMENQNDFVFLNQLMALLNDQIEYFFK